MSEVKHLLDALLCDIYGQQQLQHRLYAARTHSLNHTNQDSAMVPNVFELLQHPEELKRLSICKLIDICAILKVEMRLMGYVLERVLISRDRCTRQQEMLCALVTALLQFECDDAQPKMRFSLSPPPPKATYMQTSPTTSIHTNNHTNTLSTSMHAASRSSSTASNHRDQQRYSPADTSKSIEDATAAAAMSDDTASDYNQWLHAMKLVARLPGGMPPEFRRKLWLSLADKYLKSKNVDWAQEEEKCFCEKWREDDEELGIQIVKDLHRTGSNLCTGPAGSTNQAKLKRILLGYARYNPEVGYCQGFNMLGALILQVMDKEESESIKVMIYLVEGMLPTGYFCGSMGGLQADMGVFRELMQTKLPRLAKHLLKLQGPIENAYEPPLTNVFTMQWFLTMFCTCLPMTCVLRVWDLVLIEGSDVLLRTALVLWSLLEERVLQTRTADDFYCKMGSFSSELLNGHLIDSNGLIEKVVQLGPIPDIQKLRDKHLYNIAPLRHKQGLQLYYDEEELESDEESRLAVATVWGLPWGRRGSHGHSATNKQTTENKDRLALDISLLKKQYDRLRERQQQAHIILTTACSTARQSTSSTVSHPNQTVPINQLLIGRSAILTNKGKRIGPPPGAIPPARKPSLPTILHTKPPEKQLRRGETLHWRDTDLSKRRRDSLTWKEIKADRAMIRESGDGTKSHKLRSRIGKSDSSSYSEESDGEESSTDTSLCDEDDPVSAGDKTHSSSIERSPKRKSKSSRKQKDAASKKLHMLCESHETPSTERKRPKSWAPSSAEIPFMLMTSDSPEDSLKKPELYEEMVKEEEDSATESDRVGYKRVKDLEWAETNYSPIAGDLATTKLGPLHVQTDVIELPVITSTSQLSPMPDISTFLNNSTISPLPTPKPLFLDSTNSLGSGDGDGDGAPKKFDVSDDGVINEYFERVNSVERPTKLDLFYSLNEEDNIRNAYVDEPLLNPGDTTEVAANTDNTKECEPHVKKKENTAEEDSKHNRRMELLENYSEKSSAAFIAEATNEVSTTLLQEKIASVEGRHLLVEGQVRDDNIPGENREDFKEDLTIKQHSEPIVRKPVQINRKHSLNSASKKRKDPRRLTLTRSTTMEIEERFEAFEQSFSKGNGKKEDPKETRETTNKIPSTADLEERYNTLERQLSEDKVGHSKPLPNGKHAPSGMLSSPIAECNSPNKILEDSLSPLGPQVCSDKTVSKNSIDLRGGNAGDNNSPTERKSSKDQEQEEPDAKQVKEDTKSEALDDKPAEEGENKAEKPRLTKLPSTAELEDRFNALERKKSVQKSSPTKTVKEPPDLREEKLKKAGEGVKSEGNGKKGGLETEAGGSEENAKKEAKVVKKETKEEGEEETSKESKEAKEEAKEDAKKEAKGKAEKEAEEEAKEEAIRTEVVKKSQIKSSEVGSKKEDDRLNHKKDKSCEQEPEKTGRKSPPSTEELEKRFRALEKQLSTASLESTSKQAKQEEGKIIKAEKKNGGNGETSVDEKLKTSDGKVGEKSIKSFEEKCKKISEKLSEATTPKPDTLKDKNHAEKETPPSTDVVQPKSTHAKQAEAAESEQRNFAPKDVPKEGDLSKRRASEPPSTEDLEKRYESLKRRMSSKVMTKTETVEEALQRIEKEVIEEITEIDDVNQASAAKEPNTTERVDSKEKETSGKKVSSEPPSTEDLESRYEALQLKSSAGTNKTYAVKQSSAKEQTQKQTPSTPTVTPTVTPPKDVEPHRISPLAVSPANKTKTISLNSPVSRRSHTISHIPEAPPMPTTEVTTIDISSQQHQRAVIEEFQSKIKTQPNDENLKPSDINPNRKAPTARKATTSPKVDETSETHADTAFYRSRNYEPWIVQPRQMVRRFSDLPSRADLENRLQFLEKQLSKKFCKQRCASDSEVASIKHFVALQARAEASDDRPSTSHSKSHFDTDLEKRVQALEKQLSENSLKMLEAMRGRRQDSTAESETPRRLSTETIDATGKELVRYSGELDEMETRKPINISINIKMLLNKEIEKKQKETEILMTTEEIEKRLEMLEEQLKASKARSAVSAEKEEKLKENLEDKVKNTLETKAEDKAGEELASQTKDKVEAQAQEKMEAQTDNNMEEKVEDKTILIQGDKNEVKYYVPTEEPHTHTLAEELQQQLIKEELKTVTKDPELKVKAKAEADDKVKKEEISKEKKEEKNELTKYERTLANEEVTDSNKTNHKETSLEEVQQPAISPKENQADTTGSQQDTKQAKKNKTVETVKNVTAEMSQSPTKAVETTELVTSQELPQNVVINTTEVGPVDPDKKTLVLLLDNEPKAVKVRRLTRANTEELEGLFQALEKQLSDRNLIKSEDGKLKHADSQPAEDEKPSEESKAISDLTKEIEKFTSTDQEAKEEKGQEIEYDWGPDPVKRHLKRKTAYLPSTKELEARFRSLERQIKQLEDVEKIDVEHRLNEIERKIKLQYSLSHEKDLSKFLELCEGKGLDDEPETAGASTQKSQRNEDARSSPSSRTKSPYTSPSRAKDKTPYTSPTRTQSRRTPHSSPTRASKSSPYTSPSRAQSRRSPYTSPTHASKHSPYTSPTRSSRRSPYTSPVRQNYEDDCSGIPPTEELEYRYRALDLKRSKSKESLNNKSKKKSETRKQPIHPLEMLLDPSPDDSEIPTTGELEHRMRVLDEKRRTPASSPKSRTQSPVFDGRKRQKVPDEQRPKTPTYSVKPLNSPSRREPPTTDELEARMRALEEDQRFDFKMQKNFKEFNQKLKDAISPSLSFEEFKSSKSREQSPKRSDHHRPTTPKSAMRETDTDARGEDYHHYRSTSPKVLRFREDEVYRPRSRTDQRDTERMVGNVDGVLKIIEENSQMLHRILQNTLTDSSSSISGPLAVSSEGLDELGSRLMRETSPLRRTGTHTGVPLRTDDNINDRLNSIKNTIKSIDTLCEEKPYHREKCQRYIDSLFASSVHFAGPHKKTSLEDLTRSESRGHRDYTPAIRVSDHSQRPSEYYLSRSMGSAESIRSTSPLRAASPLHHRSTRDLRRDISPRRRREEEREEYESRVRRDNILPNNFLYNPSELSSSSLTKFHKVDRHLDTYKYDETDRSSSRSASRSPLRSPYESREMMMLHNTTAHTTTNSNRLDLDRPISPYRQTSHNLLGYDSLTKRSTTPVYNPGKLEIRHTTVTSTFYDRLLAEKQIEKTLSRPPSRSPVVSPSVTTKSYLDIPIDNTSNSSTTNKKTSKDNSPTTSQVHSTMGITGLGTESSYYTPRTNYTSSTYNPINLVTTSPNTTSYNYSIATTTWAATPTGNSSTNYHSAFLSNPLVTNASHTELRIRSCDNILTQLKSISTTTAGTGIGSGCGSGSTTAAPIATTPTSTTLQPIAQTTAATNISNFSSLYNPISISSFSSNVYSTNSNTINTTTTTTIATNSTTSNPINSITSLYTTGGTYNPLSSYTIRQPSDTGISSLGLYTSTLNNNAPGAAYVTSNSGTELPKI